VDAATLSTNVFDESSFTSKATFAEIHCQVERLYASQMQALDDGDAAAWAISQLTDSDVTRRHIVSNVRVERASDEVLRVSSYVPVIDTIDGGTWLISHRMVLRDDIG
jgi:hypothetical protein